MNNNYEIPSFIIKGKENLDLFKEFLKSIDTTGEDFAEPIEKLEDQEIKHLNRDIER